jgi:hypothetical protein
MQLTHLGPKIDKQIQNYLKPVTEVLVSKVPGIQSVLLAGGFGRGEGSVEIIDGKPIPVNDFELFIITKDKIDEVTVNEVAAAATAALPVSRKTGHSFETFDREVFSDTLYVDLKLLTLDDLPKLLPMIRYYELKHSSKLLWGSDIRNLMPDHSVQDLPAAEGLRVLLNRLSMTLLYFDVDFIGRELTLSESRALQYLAGKAVIDIPTALLSLSGDFVPSYKGRSDVFAEVFAERFPELAQQIPDLPKRVQKATEFKLKPNFKKQTKPLALWSFYKQTALPVLYFYLEKMSGQKVTTVQQAMTVLKQVINTQYYTPYLRYYLKHKLHVPFFMPGTTWLFQRYYNFLMMIRMQHFQQRLHLPLMWAPYGYDAHLFSTMIGLLESMSLDRQHQTEKADFNGSNLHKTYKELVTIYPVSKKNNQSLKKYWQDLDTLYADAYLLFGYLKLV